MPAISTSSQQTAPATTPPNSPSRSTKQISLTELAESLATVAESLKKRILESESTKAITSIDSEAIVSRSKASIIGFRTVHEVWNKKKSQYTTDVAPAAAEEVVTELDQYIFIVRTRTDRSSSILTVYIDINSEPLTGVLKSVLKDVRGISLLENPFSIERNCLFNMIPALMDHRKKLSNALDPTAKDHIDLLLKHLDHAYSPTVETLNDLLSAGKITYDLLWALFKPNEAIITTDEGTNEPWCFSYNHGQDELSHFSSRSFCIEGHFFGCDGESIGEATTTIEIHEFKGTKRIDALEAYPLAYHRDAVGVRRRLIENGRTFVSLTEGGNIHHRLYSGPAYYMNDKKSPQSQHVEGQIMVDALFFKQQNPNYPGFNSVSIIEVIDFNTLKTQTFSEGGILPGNRPESEEEFLICSPTVYGFSLENKIWLQFAVARIQPISWNTAAFELLAIPPNHKTLIQAMSERFFGQQHRAVFDNCITGKGQGLVILLHGPPEVGKTISAETVSQHHQVPLYSISASELSTSPSELEQRLRDIFKMASRWNACLLLDEADIFVEQRTSGDLHRHALVGTFLRVLEHYTGILFLTTNRVKALDEAIASRIHMPLNFKSLDRAARKTVWDQSLGKAYTTKGPANLDQRSLQEIYAKKLNGRDIKAVVASALALAQHEGTSVMSKHINAVIDLREEFHKDQIGFGAIENVNSYT